MIILPDRKLDYDDVLIVPQRSTIDSREAVDLLREYKFPYYEKTLKCTGIIASNMYNTGSLAMAEALAAHDCLTALHKYNKKEDILKLTQCHSGRIFTSVGQSDKDFDFANEILEELFPSSRMLRIDVANGYRSSFVEYVKRVRDYWQNMVLIMAGNVTTPEMTQELILAGADIVCVGIGGGSVCETRKVTGVGYPMLSAVIECANAAHGLNGHVCADGGCKTPGDVSKAFCAGADFVMLGGMLAGTDECDGEWLKQGNPFCITDKPHFKKTHLKFFGMSSYEAMEKFGGKEKEYRASEGKCELIPYKGPVANVMKEILGGLRSTGAYIGASRLKDFNKCAVFAKVK